MTGVQTCALPISGELIPVKLKCPFGQIGDRRWVREDYKVEASAPNERRIVGIYLCDNKPFDVVLTEKEWGKFTARKKPYTETSGRFMYKSLARIWLEITNIRVERVQDISEEDAKAEGVGKFEGNDTYSYAVSFASLWTSINAKRGYGWDKNPWVWVVEFERACRACGCTDSRACAGGCSWAEPGLCSRCVGKEKGSIEPTIIPGPEAAR